MRFINLHLLQKGNVLSFIQSNVTSFIISWLVILAKSLTDQGIDFDIEPIDLEQ